MSTFPLRQVKVEINKNKIAYDTFRLVEKCLLDKHVIIFGGYVRDMIVHDHFAKIFYNQCRPFDCPNWRQLLRRYDDVKCHPESVNRLFIPRDIDCFFQGSEKEVLEIYEELKKLGFKVTHQRWCKKYTLNPYVCHHKVKLSPRLPGTCDAIKMDMLFSECPVSPPFGRLDMMCNGLLLTGYRTIDRQYYTETEPIITFSDDTGVYEGLTREGRENVKQQIIEDIKKLQTRFVGKVDDDNRDLMKRRVENMELRGWTVTNKERLTLGETREVEYE